MSYPKRLIEVDLPIKRISEHARREKSIRHGHISTLHIWWARRPLAACRAVICASLWPDPADELCPKEFIDATKKEMIKWSDKKHLILLSQESVEHFIKVNNNYQTLDNKTFLRQLLLDFISDFANWDNSINEEYLKTARLLTHSSHISLGGDAATNPLVVDPFAGGGSIPLEAYRLGADVFASDMNPIPFLLNKLQLEYIPKYGIDLKNQFQIFGESITKAAENELSKYYPIIENPHQDIYCPSISLDLKKDGKTWRFDRIIKETPVAYLWSRTIMCEGPNCGVEVPMIRSGWLAKKSKRKIGLLITSNAEKDKVIIKISDKAADSLMFGTINKGKVTCPCCGFVTQIASIRKQLIVKNGGTNHARLICVINQITTERKNNDKLIQNIEIGKFYRLPVDSDTKWKQDITKNLSFFDQDIKELDQKISLNEIRRISLPLYGIDTWKKAFNDRQLVCNLTVLELIRKIQPPKQIEHALMSLFACVLSKIVQYNSSMCRWKPSGENLVDTFGRQALPVVWDFAETNLIGTSSGNISDIISWISKAIVEMSKNSTSKTQNVLLADAQNSPLPDHSVDLYFTDPPYYDAIPYSHLSDYIYTWSRILLKKYFSEYTHAQVSKEAEIVVDRPHRWSNSKKDIRFYEQELQNAFSEGLRITRSTGIGNVVFASKTTSSWEAFLNAIINSGWMVTGSWPLDTEMETKVAAIGQARLMSSIHLVCRPRINYSPEIQDQIGDWRDVQEELPKRIHEWMPRLAEEGVVGADAIFSCLGPALEIFSRYTKVVQAGSERIIGLREYLEKVWAAVSQEALNMVFAGGEAKSLEEDARLTAMWLWTLTAGVFENGQGEEEVEEDNEESSGSVKVSGYTLEYDTARKIAQGLGANLDELKTLVEIKGDKARLLPVQERMSKLFGTAGIPQTPVKKKKKPQLSLNFDDTEPEEETKYQMPELKVEQAGKTVLDRLHQSMLLFSSGRTEALKRFLVEDGVGKDDRFWKLAQSLTALYPKDTDERRWVEAVQTYKKSLGF